MKKIILGILIIITSSCKENKSIQSDNSYEKKISDFNIQYEKTYEYEYNFGEVDENTKFLKEYDKKLSFKYDSIGNLIETTNHDILGIKSTTINNYIKNNNSERLFYSKDKKLTGKAAYKYDKNNNLTELISYDENGKIDYKIFTKYNNKNEITESKTYDENGEIDEYSKYLNPEKNITEIQYFNKKDELTVKYLIIKNSENLVTKTIYFSDNKESSTIYKYDKNNFLTETIEYENNQEQKTLTKTERLKFPEK